MQADLRKHCAVVRRDARRLADSRGHFADQSMTRLSGSDGTADRVTAAVECGSAGDVNVRSAEPRSLWKRLTGDTAVAISVEEYSVLIVGYRPAPTQRQPIRPVAHHSDMTG